MEQEEEEVGLQQGMRASALLSWEVEEQLYTSCL